MTPAFNSKFFLVVIFALMLIQCRNPMDQNKFIDIQGHRGCRGLMPENTIEAFKKALDLGVNTLEMDVIISADSMVVVSHEAFLNHEITLLHNGDTISSNEEKKYNLYEMSYDEIKSFDVGTKVHPRFTLQQKIKTYKPLLSEVFTTCEAHATQTGRTSPLYNIEIKTEKNSITPFNPEAKEFVNLVMAVIQAAGTETKTTIQSFDHDILVKAHQLFPTLKYAMLVEDTLGYDYHIQKIGFTPTSYSPYYLLVDKDLVKKCHDSNVLLVPWTINTASEVETMLKLGIDGVITDYPDMAIEVLESLSKKI